MSLQASKSHVADGTWRPLDLGAVRRNGKFQPEFGGSGSQRRAAGFVGVAWASGFTGGRPARGRGSRVRRSEGAPLRICNTPF